MAIATSTPSISHRTMGLTGARVLAICLGVFGIVFAANGTLIYYALTSAPGLVSRHAYDDGIAWNEVLARQEKQDRLGWRAGLTLDPATAAGQPVRLVLRLVDRAGAMLDDAEVTGSARRPVDEATTVPFRLHAMTDGTYAGPVDLTRAGQWQITLEVRRAGKSFAVAQRLVVP